MKSIGEILGNELERRRRNNSAYSLRSFASYLEISPATLSQIISGKRGMSTNKMKSVLSRLGFSPSEQGRIFAKSKIGPQVPRSTKVLKDDQFKLISEWHHYAILSLGDLKTNSSDPRWIARRLNIPMHVANQAMGRLERMGLIEIKDGKYRQITEPLKTTSDIPSSSIRRFHREILGLAQNRMELVDLKDREYSAITMAVNSKNMKKAKVLVQQFKEEMLELMEQGPLDEVYQLSVQLFPLTTKGVK